MKYIIHYNDFCKTFTDAQNEDVAAFRRVKKLHEQGYSKLEILQKMEVSRDKLYQWRYTNIRPIPINIIETAMQRGYLDCISERKLEVIAYLVGFNLGDGNVSRNLCSVWFYGVSSDLESVKRKLELFDVSPVIYTYKVNNGKMAIHDHVFSRFLICMGAVVGDKTKTAFKVPEWVLNSGPASRIKRKFLQGFFDSELSSPKLEGNRKFAHRSMRLYSVKEKSFVKQGIIFLEQIRQMLLEFEVCSSALKLDRKYFRDRDGSEMQQLFFIISSNYINLYNFIKNIGFLYNSKRKEICRRSFPRIKELAQVEFEKNRKYNMAIELRERGLSAYKIADELDLEPYHVKNWVYFNRKPRLYKFLSAARQVR